jgi:hypothetical protein
MISSRTAFRISLASGFGILVLAAFSIAGGTPPVCGGLAPNYAPIIAFELARSVADLHAIFGDHAGVCRSVIAAQMDSANKLDSVVFIPLYGSFLAFFFLGQHARAPARARAGVWLTIIACVADQIENMCLFHLSANPDAASPWLIRLFYATETKWVLLGIAGACGGAILWNSGRWVARLAIIPSAIGAVVTFVSIWNPSVAGPYMSLAISCGWIVFLLADVAASFGKRA